MQGRDTDPTETREWVDALEGVIEVEGAERAHYLLERVLDGARRKGAPVPYSANTPYLNTIPPEKEERHPGGKQPRTSA
jgi:pyruvate dehydrogenase E1 component